MNIDMFHDLMSNSIESHKYWYKRQIDNEENELQMIVVFSIFMRVNSIVVNCGITLEEYYAFEQDLHDKPKLVVSLSNSSTD
jgi:hypothetical protein